MMLARLLGACLSPRGERAGLSILIFHRVLPQPDPLFPGEPDARRFDEILSWLGRGFHVLPLDEAIVRLGAGTLPARALAITFDDGYADNYTVALPILLRHRMTAAFFVVSDVIGGGRMWNDTVIEAVRRAPGDILDLGELGLGRFAVDRIATRRAAIDRLLPALKYLAQDEREHLATEIAARGGGPLPDDLMMNAEQLRALRAAGMVVGGHTRSHPILARLDDAEAFDEIAGGKARLEAILGERVALFAYPNGKPGTDYLARHAEMVARAGFEAAVSTSPGMARRGTDRFQLPRFTPWDRTRLRFGLRLVSNMQTTGVTA